MGSALVAAGLPQFWSGVNSQCSSLSRQRAVHIRVPFSQGSSFFVCFFFSQSIVGIGVGQDRTGKIPCLVLDLWEHLFSSSTFDGVYLGGSVLAP